MHGESLFFQSNTTWLKLKIGFLRKNQFPVSWCDFSGTLTSAEALFWPSLLPKIGFLWFDSSLESIPRFLCTFQKDVSNSVTDKTLTAVASSVAGLNIKRIWNELTRFVWLSRIEFEGEIWLFEPQCSCICLIYGNDQFYCNKCMRLVDSNYWTGHIIRKWGNSDLNYFIPSGSTDIIVSYCKSMKMDIFLKWSSNDPQLAIGAWWLRSHKIQCDIFIECNAKTTMNSNYKYYACIPWMSIW